MSFNKSTFETTYKDDFDSSDNFHRILFNSGRALQVERTYANANYHSRGDCKVW